MQSENINPIMEALTYYRYRACGKSIYESLNRYMDISEALKIELRQRFNPIKQLESILNEQLNIPQSIIKQYFKPMDEGMGVRGFSLADIIYMIPSHSVFVDFDTAEKEILSYTSDEKREIITASLVRNNKLFSESDLSCDNFLKVIERQHMSDEEKWRLILLYNNFDSIAAEVSYMLRTAVEIIQNNSSIYEGIIDEFNACYSKIEGNLGAYFSAQYDANIPVYDDGLLFPWLFGYGYIQSVYSDELNKTSFTFLGVLVDFIAKKVRKKLMPNDCDSLLKVLSDPNRANILKYLCDKNAYGLELAEYLKLSPNTVSHHINKLLINGFITSEAEGNRVYYQSNKDNIEKFLKMLSAMFLGR